MSQEELDAMLKSMADNSEDAGNAEGDRGMATASSSAVNDENTGAETVKKTKKPLVQRVEFAQLKSCVKPGTRKPHGSLFNNIPLVLSAELGTAEITVRDLLALEEGSVVKLDKTAGESATVLVNEQFLGQAETVVVNDRFGLRITTIGKEMLHDKKEIPEKENIHSKPAPDDYVTDNQAEE